MEEAVQNTDGYSKRPFWHWLVIYFILGVIIYGAIYYFFLRNNAGYNYSKSSNQYSAPTSSMNASPSSAMMNETTVALTAVNNSGESGTATITETGGQTKVMINLTGFTKDVEQPAHIHLGVCPGVGAVKYPLTPIMNGTSVTVIPVTIADLKKQLPLAINVHKSKTEVSSYTACGPLSIK